MKPQCTIHKSEPYQKKETVSEEGNIAVTLELITKNLCAVKGMQVAHLKALARMNTERRICHQKTTEQIYLSTA